MFEKDKTKYGYPFAEICYDPYDGAGPEKMDKSNFTRYSRASAEEMIKYLEEEEYLDSESFRYLEPIVRKEITISNRELYTFKVQVKEEYRKYLKPKI